MLTHQGTKPIETSRLLLRRAAPGDKQAMFQNWASDPEVTKFLTWKTYETPDTADKRLGIWMECYEKPDFYQWMIVPKELGQPIGTISVGEQNEKVGEMEIGYCIGRRWWHQGIMTEALHAVMDYLFMEVNANRLKARHDPRNPHSGGVMAKCGMQYEGTLRQCAWNNQGICDTAVYGILRQEWEVLRGI